MLPAFEGNDDLADLAHAAAKDRAVLLEEPLLGDGAGSDHRRGQPCGRPSAAARIADAVLLPVGEVGVTGAELLRDLAVVLATLVGVLNQQRDRCARGLAFIHAAENLHSVGFVALGDVTARTRPTAVQIPLNIGFAERHARRAPINHAPDRRPMRLAKVGNCEKGAKSIAAHSAGLSQQSRNKHRSPEPPRNRLRRAAGVAPFPRGCPSHTKWARLGDGSIFACCGAASPSST